MRTGPSHNLITCFALQVFSSRFAPNAMQLSDWEISLLKVFSSELNMKVVSLFSFELKMKGVSVFSSELI